jgi:hypothetical protein
VAKAPLDRAEAADRVPEVIRAEAAAPVEAKGMAGAVPQEADQAAVGANPEPAVTFQRREQHSAAANSQTTLSIRQQILTARGSVARHKLSGITLKEMDSCG